MYDERGTHAVLEGQGSGPKDGLLGITGATVTVRFGSIIYTYGERGRRYSPRPHDGSCDPGRADLGTIDALVAVDRHDRPANPRNGLLERL